MTHKHQTMQVLLTRGVAEAMKNNSDFRRDLIIALDKYNACDWGVTSGPDKAMNDKAVKTGDPDLLAAYETCIGRIWIKGDSLATTVLFPNEY